jgi:hypothetical protein
MNTILNLACEIFLDVLNIHTINQIKLPTPIKLPVPPKTCCNKPNDAHDVTLPDTQHHADGGDTRLEVALDIPYVQIHRSFQNAHLIPRKTSTMPSEVTRKEAQAQQVQQQNAASGARDVETKEHHAKASASVWIPRFHHPPFL